MTRQQFLKKIAVLGVTLDTENEEFNLNMDAPPGKIFQANGCHSICTAFNNPCGQSWKSEAYQEAWERVRMGLWDCLDMDCTECDSSCPS